MRCRDIQNTFTSYADGQLSQGERDQVQAHLRECQSCRALLGEVDHLAAVLLRADIPTVPSDLTIKIMAAARNRGFRESSTSWNPLSWWRLASAPMHAAALGVLIVGLSLGFALGWSSAPSPQQLATTAPPDPLEIYQLDYLGDAPSGSLADGYLTLIAATDEGKR